MRNGCCTSGGGSNRRAVAWDEYINSAPDPRMYCDRGLGGRWPSAGRRGDEAGKRRA